MNTLFTGAGTALVVPFRTDLSIDENALRALVNRQIEDGIDFLVPCGTTGEAPTLSHDEHKLVIKMVIEEAAGRVPVIPGTGSNCTAEAVELTLFAKEAGADGGLVMPPYYSRPTQEGILAHYDEVTKVGLPVTAYNIPSRCAVDILAPTMAELSKNPLIVAIKQATGSIQRVMQDMQMCEARILHLSGDDALTFPIMALGGHGVISVISNFLTKETVELTRAVKSGNLALAREIHFRLLPIIEAMFVETNPMPVKAAMAMLGLIEPVWRSPMIRPKDSTLAIIEERLRQFGLNPKSV